MSSTHYAVEVLFSDDLPSLGEPETRSQFCQRFPYSIVHHPVVTVADYEPRDMVITWQPCGKFSCFRKRRVAESSLAPQDSLHVSDYSQLKTMLFEVSIQRQRLQRLQYAHRFTKQHFFTDETYRTNRTGFEDHALMLFTKRMT